MLSNKEDFACKSDENDPLVFEVKNPDTYVHTAPLEIMRFFLQEQLCSAQDRSSVASRTPTAILAILIIKYEKKHYFETINCRQHFIVCKA